MGGRGSGGRRPGAGRKPKFKVVPPPSANSDAGAAECTEVAVPETLTADQRAVWLQLAPHAVARGTLTRATAMSFELLCRNVVLERTIARDAEQVGGANHRGVIQRIDAEMLAFDLRPNGKPHGAVVKPGSEQPKSRLEMLKARRAGLKVV